MPVDERSSFLGSALILAGTSIGAGMLALPLVAAGVGFILMLTLFFITAFFAVFSAFLTYEANLIVEPGCNLYTMATRTLGKAGRVLSIVAPLGLFYALLAAYLSGGGTLFSQYFATTFPNLTPQLSIVLCAFLTAIFVYASTKVVDHLNRVLFLLMIVFFLISLVVLLPEVSYERIIYTAKVDSLPLIAAVPIVFTSFGYHGSIPSIILYQENKFKYIPLIFIIATLIPLLVYLLWLVAVMGSIPESQLLEISRTSGATASLIETLGGTQKGWFTLNTHLHLFSDFALLTSVLGVALGLFDYLASLMHQSNDRIGRAQSACVTFIPPVMIAIIYPDGFVAALGYAAIALSILALLLPSAIVYVLRKRKQQIKSFRTPGGNGIIFSCAIFGIIVIIAQLITVI